MENPFGKCTKDEETCLFRELKLSRMLFQSFSTSLEAHLNKCQPPKGKFVNGHHDEDEELPIKIGGSNVLPSERDALLRTSLIKVQTKSFNSLQNVIISLVKKH